MLVQLFKDALNEYAYAAELAGLKWELVNTKYGLIVSIYLSLFFLNRFMIVIQLAVGGYNNKQHVLLQKIMDKLTDFKIDPKRFYICKENVSYDKCLKHKECKPFYLIRV